MVAKNRLVKAIFSIQILAERTRFELADVSVSGFQDQCLQPLGHLSVNNYIILFSIRIDIRHIIKIVYG